MTDPGQVDRAVKETLKAYGRIDILINCAGQVLNAAIEKIEADDFRDIFELNVLAPLVMMQHVIPAMREQGAGSIVNVSSGIWFHPLAESAALQRNQSGAKHCVGRGPDRARRCQHCGIRDVPVHHGNGTGVVD